MRPSPCLLSAARWASRSPPRLVQHTPIPASCDSNKFNCCKKQNSRTVHALMGFGDLGSDGRALTLGDGSTHPMVGFGTYKIGFVPASSNTAGQVSAWQASRRHCAGALAGAVNLTRLVSAARPRTRPGPQGYHQGGNCHGIQVHRLRAVLRQRGHGRNRPGRVRRRAERPLHRVQGACAGPHMPGAGVSMLRPQNCDRAYPTSGSSGCRQHLN